MFTIIGRRFGVAVAAATALATDDQVFWNSSAGSLM